MKYPASRPASRKTAPRERPFAPASHPPTRMTQTSKPLSMVSADTTNSSTPSTSFHQR